MSRKLIISVFYIILFQPGLFYSQSIEKYSSQLSSSILPQCFEFDKNGNLLVGTYSHGLWRSTDSGNSWNYVGLNQIDVNALYINSDGYIFVGNYGGHDTSVYRSTDNGVTWEKSILQNSYAVNAFIETHSGNIYAGTHNNGLFRSTNKGVSWIKIPNFYSQRIYSFTENKLNYIYVGNWLGGLSRTTDEGVTWSAHGTGTIGSSAITAIKLDSLQNIFVGLIGNIGVFKSTNNGDSWIEKNNGLTNKFVWSMAVKSNGSIFAGTLNGGVFKSTNGGDSWSYSGLDLLRVYGLIVDSVGNVFAGGGSFSGAVTGVFKSTDDGSTWANVFNTTNVKNEEINFYKYSLEQNYPNPFNPTTKIRYSIKYNGLVTLKVFDLLSSEVAMLVNEPQSVGMYEIEFDGNKYGLSSGVYFCQLRSGSFTQAMKFVYLR